MHQHTATKPSNQALSALLLDDDEFMLEFLADMLSDLGLTQITKELSAKHALLTVKEQAPDLLICDLSMPNMDGFEFLSLIAQQAYKGAVLLHSNMDTGVLKAAERLAKAQGLNVLGAIQKPIDKAGLAEFIKQLIKRA